MQRRRYRRVRQSPHLLFSCSCCCSALADADSCYPLLLAHRRPVYSNTVRNVWGRWSIFQQLLVQRGYTVVQVDLRGSTGNGRVFREEFTANVGGQDLEDLVATVSLLTTPAQTCRFAPIPRCTDG